MSCTPLAAGHEAALLDGKLGHDPRAAVLLGRLEQQRLLAGQRIPDDVPGTHEAIVRLGGGGLHHELDGSELHREPEVVGDNLDGADALVHDREHVDHAHLDFAPGGADLAERRL
jgi:hypothetical protein